MPDDHPARAASRRSVQAVQTKSKEAWLDLFDEDALIDSLRSGHLGGAGLDVFTTEPLPESSALWDLPNVIVTPHSSGTSQRTYQRAVDIFTDNLGRFVAGAPLRNPV